MNAIIERLVEDLHRTLDEIVGRHPALASSYTPLWTRQLQDQEPAEAFDAKPKKRKGKR